MTLADETVAMVATVVSSGGANLAQERAIGHPVDRPLKVAAGPGTGKTYLLAERYLRLLSAEGLAPHQILALTFTNRAAGEMRERIARHGLLSGTLASTLDLSEAWIGTFHGTCLRLLQEQPLATGLTRGLAAIDGVERQRLRADIRERLLDGALGDEGWQPDDALLLELADDGFWRGAWATVDRLQDLLVAPEEFLVGANERATRPRAEAETWASAQASTASKTSRSRDKAQAAAANASADYALLPGLAAIVATVYRAYRGGALQSTVPAHPGRRGAGHLGGANAPGRRAGRAGPVQRDGDRRRQAVDLRLAWGAAGEPGALPASRARRRRDRAGAQLSLLPGDRRRGGARAGPARRVGARRRGGARAGSRARVGRATRGDAGQSRRS